MKKTILTFGLISGAISSLLMGVTIMIANRIGLDRGAFVGYTTIVLSFLLVFFGIRSYRDTTGNGQITFAKAFIVGISITLISCICYVITWEIIFFQFMPDFMHKYAAHVMQKAQASGASPAALQAQSQQMTRLEQLYNNPLYNAAVTFIEPFPVGLAITLISSVVLRRTRTPQPAQSPLPT
ncbi:DUF4199 domain-containing protein [Alloacidobacterium dinghuense]|uniref:DUF4199 domain-containing protein n=1 Tax=Alloacidobacterium dinghuense TaxID=2763107 RepID=A0A7G8BI31_9BACT|nr:DUF4199 domain-containing protein [Alloacidobacterium dinghuense]QNI32201.1 DUF4199 domain-containing protein [Alloacidobacterium dinghuense]